MEPTPSRPGPAWAEITGPISLRDSAIRWTEAGPSCPRDEVVEGVLALLPPDDLPADDEEENWISSPSEVAQKLVTGLLRYLSVRV